MTGEGSSAGDVSDARPLWQPSGGWLLLLRAMHWTILVGLLFVAARWGTRGQGMFEGFVVASVSLIVAFAIHECGTYAAARLFGMVVFLVRFGSLDLKPVRGGWKVRWKAQSYVPRYTLVYAVPDPGRPLRGPCIALTIGGTVATLCLGAVVAVCLVFAEYARIHSLLVLALCASLLPLVYLFPSSTNGKGTAIEAWRWWRHPPTEQQMRSSVVHSRLVWGAPASSFSDEDIDALGFHIPMNRLWYVTKAAQQRGQWSEVVRLQEEWNAAIPNQARMREYLADITADTASELKWMDAVQHRDAALLPDGSAIRASAWSNPALGARCAATVAWLAGDDEAMRHATAEAVAIAGRSLDRSLVVSERLILEALAATPQKPL